MESACCGLPLHIMENGWKQRVRSFTAPTFHTRLSTQTANLIETTVLYAPFVAKRISCSPPV